jgi:hypothetical protein
MTILNKYEGYNIVSCMLVLNSDGLQFTNINKTNNHFSPQSKSIEHKKKPTTTYDIGNPGLSLRPA